LKELGGGTTLDMGIYCIQVKIISQRLGLGKIFGKIM